MISIASVFEQFGAMAGAKRARSGPQHGNTDQIKNLLQGDMPLMVWFSAMAGDARAGRSNAQ